MTTIRLDISLQGLENAAEIVAGGGVVAYPTETFYGLAADAFSAKGVEAVVQAKGRGEERPIGLILASIDDLERVASSVSSQVRAVAEKMWPGPLTLVVPAHSDLPPRVVAGGSTVGVRMTSHVVAQKLATLVKGPITATSANLHGLDPPVDPSEVLHQLDGLIDAVIEGGTTVGEKSSTVAEIVTGEVHIHREGAVSVDEIVSHLS